MGSSDHEELKMLRLQKNWHLICCVLWAVISVLAIIPITATENPNPLSSITADSFQENLHSSAEIEPSQENSALLRNFFSVNLQKSSQHPPPPPHPTRQQISSRKLPIVSKHGSKARLRGLFKALRNPLAHAKFMRHKNIRRLHHNQQLASLNEKRRQFQWKQQQKQQKQQKSQKPNFFEKDNKKYEKLIQKPTSANREPPQQIFHKEKQPLSPGRPQQPSKRKQPRGSGLKRPLNRRPPLLKRLEKEPLPPKRKLEPYKKNMNIRIPVVKKQELKPKSPLFQQSKRREEVPKRLRYPEKKPVLKKGPVTEPKQQPKPPIQTLVKNPSINVDEFSAPAAPIKQNIQQHQKKNN